MGVANDRSIAWGIAKTLAEHGAELAFSYQIDQLERRVRPLAESVGSNMLIKCDASDDEGLDSLFAEIEEKWGSLDFIVHAIAFSDRNELTGKYVNTSRDNFQLTMDVSCYSLTALCQRAHKLMPDTGSIITLTYYGSERVMPHYNVMGVAKAALEASVRYLAVDLGAQGIRVNAISAGPIKTLAASGVKNFRKMLSQHSERAPLGRTVTTEEVGNAAAFLCSDYASGITGEITYVDAGFNTAAMPLVDLE